jgi:proprotein convertase subtilisin/kexin type 5
LCLTCNDGYLNSDKTTCVPGCIGGKYLSAGKCAVCDTSCKTCSDAKTCVTCPTNTYLLKGTCVAECGVGLYENGKNQQCQPCNKACATCTGGAQNNCDSCPA